jgi:transcriptional regulator with XRE-family HTH domain
MPSLADSIDSAIKRSGKTAREVAVLVGVHESTVSLWTTGGRTPRMKHLEKLAQVLGLELAELWAGAEAVPATAEQSAMIDEMGNLTIEQQQVLLATARAMRGAKS